MTHQISPAQLKEYEQNGFLILRGAISDAEIKRLEAGLARATPVDTSLDPTAPTPPEPGRYTFASQCPKDPDLAFIIEHPQIVGPAAQLLKDDPRLSAYVLYDRSPGGKGIPTHQDYKRWRPVGSSMNWLFTIVPFTDFNDVTGKLEVVPGSHRLDRIREGSTPCLEIDPAIRPDESDFIDPELKRGDLLFMNMHVWHRAPINTSDQHRVGLFNKYAGASTPPATGWYRYDTKVVEALSPENRDLIAVHGETQVSNTRAILTRDHNGEPEVLCLPDTETKTDAERRWMLPGGVAAEERAIPDWDHGNVIASLQQHLREQIAGEAPWMSYIGDYDEPEGVSRVYGYDVAQGRIAGETIGTWLPLSELEPEMFRFGWELDALKLWLDPGITRGKGLSQMQSRIDQFAY